MSALPYWHVDAFADRPFTGNQAAVMPLTSWLPDKTLQAYAQSGPARLPRRASSVVSLFSRRGWSIAASTRVEEHAAQVQARDYAVHAAAAKCGL